MATENIEYKFPDETDAKPDEVEVVVEGESPSVEVEVVDDTPESDRNRKPMVEPPKEFADDELERYDEAVRKRIKHFTKGYHEERRAKEAALREREEAVRAAQLIADENKRLKGSLSQGQAVLLDQAKKTVAADLETAKRKYKEAYEAGDADALVLAQDELTSARIRADKVNNFKPPVETPEAETPVVPTSQPIDHRAQAWQEENRWFGSDEEMTGFALALHSKLVKQGVDPSSDEYYDKVNARIRQVFPDAFPRERSATTSTSRASVVAPATRSTAPKKVVLTRTQVEVAKRLGVPLELYARKFAETLRK